MRTSACRVDSADVERLSVLLCLDLAVFCLRYFSSSTDLMDILIPQSKGDQYRQRSTVSVAVNVESQLMRLESTSHYYAMFQPVMTLSFCSRCQLVLTVVQL
jgi:hypothetical protein